MDADKGRDFVFQGTDIFSKACSQKQGKGKYLNPFGKTRRHLRDLRFLQTRGNERNKGAWWADGRQKPGGLSEADQSSGRQLQCLLISGPKEQNVFGKAQGQGQQEPLGRRCRAIWTWFPADLWWLRLLRVSMSLIRMVARSTPAASGVFCLPSWFLHSQQGGAHPTGEPWGASMDGCEMTQGRIEASCGWSGDGSKEGQFVGWMLRKWRWSSNWGPQWTLCERKGERKARPKTGKEEQSHTLAGREGRWPSVSCTATSFVSVRGGHEEGVLFFVSPC